MTRVDVRRGVALRAVVALGALGLLSAGCAMRPRYQEFVSAERLKDTAAPLVSLTVTDPSTGQPLGGAKVEIGEFPKKFSAVAGADGVVNVPLDKRYHADNAIIAVTLPKGVARYKLVATPVAPVETAASAGADAGAP